MGKILIVDDEPSIAGLLSLVFRRSGFEVQVARSAEEAKALCGSGGFDLVLSDVVMPGMDGHALVRWFVTHCPRGRVVLMSGFDPGCNECPYKSGCPFVRKPFAPAEVVDFVRSVLASGPPPC